MWRRLIAACLLLASARAAGLPDCQEGDAGCALPAAVTTLYRRTKSWDDYAQAVAVLRLGSAPTALHFVPGVRPSAPPRWLAVGDAGGALHLLCPATGRVVAQHATGTASPVTALGSYRTSSNTTVLASGHASGAVHMHTLVQPRPAPRGSDDGGDEPAPAVALLRRLPPAELLCGASAATACADEGVLAAEQRTCAAPCAAIVAVHGQGRGARSVSTLVALDAGGGMAFIKHGAEYGQPQVVRRVALDGPPLAARLSGFTVSVLAGEGITGLRLAAPAAQAGDASAPARGGTAAAEPPASRPCLGLNGTTLLAAAFDGQHPGRAYGLASDGRWLSLALGGGDKAAQPTCRVRGVAPPPAGPSQAGQLALAPLPGYLAAAAGGELLVLNVSLAPRRPPRLLLRQPLAALAERFGAEAQHGGGGGGAPLLAASRAGHVAVALGGHALALFETALPHRPPAPAPLASMAWLQMFQPAALLLVGGLVLYRAKQRRRGGGGGGGGSGPGWGLSGDPRLREFERLLQDPMTAATRRGPAPPAWAADDDSGSGSGSEGEGSGLLARLRGKSGGGAAPLPKRRPPPGRASAASGSAAAGGARSRDAARARAFALAAADDAETSAGAPPAAGGGSSSGEDEEMSEAERDGPGRLGGAFGSELDMRRPSVDVAPLDRDLSQLRHRLGQARIS